MTAIMLFHYNLLSAVSFDIFILTSFFMNCKFVFKRVRHPAERLRKLLRITQTETA